MTQCTALCAVATLPTQIYRCQSVKTCYTRSAQPRLRSRWSCDVNRTVYSHRADHTDRRFPRHENDLFPASLCVMFWLTEADWRALKKRFCWLHDYLFFLSDFRDMRTWISAELYNSLYRLHCVQEKRPTLISAYNFAKCRLIFRTLSTPHSALIVKNLISLQTQTLPCIM